MFTVEEFMSRGQSTRLINLNPESGLQRRIVTDGFEICGNEYIDSPTGLEDDNLVCQLAQRLSDRAIRIYYAPVKDYSAVRFVEYPRVSWPFGGDDRFGPTLPSGFRIDTHFRDWYSLNGKRQIHPGIDVNGTGGGDSDLGSPVYAIADGTVVYAAMYPKGSWGNIVMIRHDLPDGRVIWSQYAHLNSIPGVVTRGTRVLCGQTIGGMGKGRGDIFSAHLHFEVRNRELPAGYWPGTNEQAVRESYIDPIETIIELMA